MSRVTLLPVVFIAVTLLPATAFAQDRPGSVYILAGAALAHQPGPDGEASVTYVTAPGGTTLAWFAGGGVVMARWMTVEGEFSSTGIMDVREPSRYNMTFNEERRDRFLTVAARFSIPIATVARIEPVAGMVVTFPQAWFRTERAPFGTPQPVVISDPRQEHRLDTSIGPMVGCDLRIGRGRVTVLPSLRILGTGVSHGYYGDSSYHREIESIYPGGYPKWTIRSGLAMRVGF